jgi:hypothetical protein
MDSRRCRVCADPCGWVAASTVLCKRPECWSTSRWRFSFVAGPHFFTAGRRNSCNRLAGIAVQVTVGRMMALRKHQEWREGSDPLTARQPGPRKPRCQGQPGNGNDVASGGNPRATPFSSDFVPEGQHPWAENVLPPHPHPFSPRSASLAWVRWNPPSSPHSSTPTRCC